MTGTAFETFRLAVDAKGLKVKDDRQGHFQFACPSHDDKNPSVTADYRDGKVLAHCHSGCDVRDIVADLGLSMEDMFDEEPSNDNFTVVARYKYTDGGGRHVFTKLRTFPKSFRVMHPDERTPGMPKEMPPWLYHAVQLREGAKRGDALWLVEGEADVHAMEHMGAVATTQPFGAGPDKWTPWHTSLLDKAGVKDVRIVVDLDETDKRGKNPGRDYAFAVMASLQSVGIKVTLWKAKAGKDASDHLRAGHTLEDFEAYPLPRVRPQGITHAELLVREFKPLVFAVERILPQGLALFGGPPKLGKSLIALNMAMAVASGEKGRALSALSVTPGRVLYIGMEDSMRRLKERCLSMELGNGAGLDNIEFQPIESGWPGGVEGMAMMEEWALDGDDPRLIVVDTLARVEPELDDAKDRYRAEYSMTLRYKKFADRHNVSVLMVHHDKKGEELDWLSRFSGSRGLTGGVDTLMFLDGKRGEPEAILRVTGRDIEGDDLPLRTVRGRPGWIISEVPDTPEGISATRMNISESSLTGAEQVVLSALRGLGGMAARKAVHDQFAAEDQALCTQAVQMLMVKGLVRGRGDSLALAE